MSQVVHYDDGEQTIQVSCIDGKFISFHVDEQGETPHLRVTFYPDDDPAGEALYSMSISPDVATQAIQELNRSDFLRALSGG
jgi:hypothetical protein